MEFKSIKNFQFHCSRKHAGVLPAQACNALHWTAVFCGLNMTHYHLYAIGNALVDSEYDVSDDRLAQMGVSKRHMTLIDEAQRCALLADDELGAFYRDDLQAQGVASNLQHTQLHPGQTGTCLVLVTPDAERTMCTYLGATAALDPSALHPQDIARSQVYYMEGYLASSPTGLQAALQGLDLARQSGVRTALTLSDVSMIHFCRDGLQAMLGDGVDLLFANEEEAQTWCGSQDLPTVLRGLAPLARTVCLTRGPKGALLIEGERLTEVAGVPAKAVDTNGAGDMFAGAYLYGITHGMPSAQAAPLANHAAAAVVAQHGCRLTREHLQGLLKAVAG